MGSAIRACRTRKLSQDEGYSTFVDYFENSLFEEEIFGGFANVRMG